MVQDYMNPNITFLGENLKTKFTSVILGKNRKIPIKSVKIKILKNKKKQFFPHVPRITQPKNEVPMSKGVTCSPRTDGQTDRHESDYRGYPFQVFRSFSFNLSSRIGPTTFPYFRSEKLTNNIAFWILEINIGCGIPFRTNFSQIKNQQKLQINILEALA